MDSDETSPAKWRKTVLPLLIAGPAWLAAATLPSAAGVFVAMAGAIVGPHRPLLTAMQSSKRRAVVMAAPGLHLCLMTFAWVVPFFSADLWAYHWEHGSLLGFVPYAVVAIMTVLAALGLASIEAYFKPGPTSREVCVWAVYCGTMLTSCGLTNDLVSEGAAEYMSGSSDSSFLMLAFPSMAFYALLLPIRAYVNRRKKPSATDADNVQEASADQE